RSARCHAQRRGGAGDDEIQRGAEEGRRAAGLGRPPPAGLRGSGLLLGGLSTPEIARAFLAPEATVAQRIVRAKRTLRDAAIPFETPRGGERRERIAAVLEVV